MVQYLLHVLFWCKVYLGPAVVHSYISFIPAVSLSSRHGNSTLSFVILWYFIRFRSVLESGLLRQVIFSIEKITE